MTSLAARWLCLHLWRVSLVYSVTSPLIGNFPLWSRVHHECGSSARYAYVICCMCRRYCCCFSRPRAVDREMRNINIFFQRFADLIPINFPVVFFDQPRLLSRQGWALIFNILWFSWFLIVWYVSAPIVTLLSRESQECRLKSFTNINLGTNFTFWPQITLT